MSGQSLKAIEPEVNAKMQLGSCKKPAHDLGYGVRNSRARSSFSIQQIPNPMPQLQPTPLDQVIAELT